jgi:hypothetical protein
VTRSSLPTPEEARVSLRDLDARDDALKILKALNDPFCSARNLAPHIERLPALRARVSREHHAHFMPKRELPFAEQLQALGNGALERVLFQYLEDLTIFGAESDDGPIVR